MRSLFTRLITVGVFKGWWISIALIIHSLDCGAHPTTRNKIVRERNRDFKKELGFSEAIIGVDGHATNFGLRVPDFGDIVEIGTNFFCKL